MLLLCIALGASLLSTTTALAAREIGFFSVTAPGFTSVFNYTYPDRKDLFLTTFQLPTSALDEIYVVQDIGSHLDTIADAPLIVVTDALLWPNEIERVPDDVLGEEGYLWIASGFITDGKSNGTISLLNPKRDGYPAPHTVISTDTNGFPWFYHRAEFIDMNNDGLKDCLTARARILPEGGEVGELVWFENQGSLDVVPWQPHVIADGPDVFFRTVDLELPDGKVKHCVISAQYFSEQLTITWTDDPDGIWTDPGMIQMRIIDEGLGHYFDLEVTDLNMDGRLDVMVTVNRNFNGTVWGYEIPDDFIAEEWPKHMLADDFDGGIGEGRGAPGSGFIFRSESQPARNKPLVMVSGDDDGTLYLLEPNSDTDVNDWTYLKTALWSTSGTLGGVTATDVDNDVYEEMFCPAWTVNRLHTLTFAP